jgi:D-tagatose-1,6-bisphosphate aldolase subunit GatZ/KbaZ
MLSRYLPMQYLRLRKGEISADPESLIIDKIRDVLRMYAAACSAGR